MKRLLSCVLALMLLLGSFSFAMAEEPASIFPLKDEITLTALVIGMPGGVDYEDNYVTQWIKEKTNINLEFTYALSGDDGKTKLNLLLYGNDKLPDVFINTRWTKAECELYGNEGLVLELSDLLKDCVNWNKLNEECPARLGDLMLTGGNIYTYGDTNECFHCTHAARMWMYKPWLDKLNDGVLPTTTDELYDYLKKVKTMDPNGNGKDDEIPFTGYLGGWCSEPFVFISNAFVQNNNFIANATNTLNGGFMLENGKVVYTLNTDAYRDSLRYMNKLFKESLLDSQTYTQGSDQCNASVNNEEHLVAMMGGGVPPQFSGDLWKDWVLLPPLKGPDGVQYAYTSLDQYFGSCVGLISKDCQYPEIAIQLFDLLSTPEGNRVQNSGAEGITWKWTDEMTTAAGGKSIWATIDTYEHEDEDGSPNWVAYGYDHDFKSWTWDADGAIRGDTVTMRDGQGVEDPNGPGSILSVAPAIYHQYAFAPESIIPDLPFSADQAKALSEYLVSVGAYANSASIRFITGDLDIEKDWDSYLTELEKMDLKGYTAVIQAAYDATTK